MIGEEVSNLRFDSIKLMTDLGFITIDCRRD